MSKIIKTRTVKAVASTLSAHTSLVDDNCVNNQSTGFDSLALSSDASKALVQDSGLANEILANLQETYHLLLVNKDLALGTIINWVASKIDILSDTQLQRLSDRNDVSEIALELISNHVVPADIRAGRLDKNHTIPLVGENNHVKKYSNR